MREWRHVVRIALGWLLNLSAFVVMLSVFVVYGCTFRGLAADDNSQVEGRPSNSSVRAAPLAPCASRQHAPLVSRSHTRLCTLGTVRRHS